MRHAIASHNPAYNQLLQFASGTDMSNIALLSSLQTFLNQRGVEVDRLSAEQMVHAMIDWFRIVPIENIPKDSPQDTMIFRYGGWSEGCVTGFKFTLLRRVETKDDAGTQWHSGITLLFEPSRYANVAPLNTLSTDWQTLEAFVNAIESSPGFRLSTGLTPMAVIVETQGLH
jgi:hypothetical protein